MRAEKDSVRQLVKRRQVNCIHLRELHSTSSELQLLQFRREATTSFADLRGIVCPLFEDTRRAQPPPPPPPKPKRRRQGPTPFLRPPPRLPALQRAPDSGGRDPPAKAAPATAASAADAPEGGAPTASTQPLWSGRSQRDFSQRDFGQRDPRQRDFSIPLLWPARASSEADEAAAVAAAFVDAGLRLRPLATAASEGGRPVMRRSRWDPHPVTSGLMRAKTLLT